MGSDAVEREVRAHDGHIALGGDLVQESRMPGIGEVHVVEVTRSRDELLRTRAFFRRAAEIDDRSVFSGLLQVFLDGHGRRGAADTQQVMAAPVTRRTCAQGLPFGASRDLAEFRQRVVFAEDRRHRLAGSAHERRRERGGDVRDPLLDGESLTGQGLLQRSGRLFLFIGQFRVAPDLPGERSDAVRLGVDHLR